MDILLAVCQAIFRGAIQIMFCFLMWGLHLLNLGDDGGNLHLLPTHHGEEADASGHNLIALRLLGAIEGGFTAAGIDAVEAVQLPIGEGDENGSCGAGARPAHG